MLAVVFIGTGSLPPPLRVLNPIVATTAAASGAFPLEALASYGLVGLACAAGAYVRLSSMVAVS